MAKKLLSAIILFATVLSILSFASCGSTSSNESGESFNATNNPYGSKSESEIYSEAKSLITPVKDSEDINTALEMFKYLGDYKESELYYERILILSSLYDIYRVHVSILKKDLKNPSSLVINNVEPASSFETFELTSFTETKISFKATMVIDYSAMNSFGGMERKTYVQTYSCALNKENSAYLYNYVKDNYLKDKDDPSTTIWTLVYLSGEYLG
jgi:hypothetical protein